MFQKSTKSWQRGYFPIKNQWYEQRFEQIRYREIKVNDRKNEK